VLHKHRVPQVTQDECKQSQVQNKYNQVIKKILGIPGIQYTKHFYFEWRKKVSQRKETWGIALRHYSSGTHGEAWDAIMIIATTMHLV